MNAELQLRIWQCLPKEAREEIKMIFNMPSKYGYPDSVRKLLIDIYGNNLTSDIEPSELLFVERKKVVDLYATMDKAFPREAAYSVQEALKSLFGDKCQPDKEPSVQVEPKLKADCKAKVVENNTTHYGEIVTLVRKEYDSWLVIDNSNDRVYFRESELEPYTEPETKDNMEEKELNRKALYNALCELESASIKVRKALISM